MVSGSGVLAACTSDEASQQTFFSANAYELHHLPARRPAACHRAQRGSANLAHERGCFSGTRKKSGVGVSIPLISNVGSAVTMGWCRSPEDDSLMENSRLADHSSRTAHPATFYTSSSQSSNTFNLHDASPHARARAVPPEKGRRSHQTVYQPSS